MAATIVGASKELDDDKKLGASWIAQGLKEGLENFGKNSPGFAATRLTDIGNGIGRGLTAIAVAIAIGLTAIGIGQENTATLARWIFEGIVSQSQKKRMIRLIGVLFVAGCIWLHGRQSANLPPKYGSPDSTNLE